MIRAFIVVALTMLTFVAANGSDSDSYPESSGSNMVESNMEVPSRNMLETLRWMNTFLSLPIDQQPEPQMKTKLLFSSLKWIMDLMHFDAGSIALQRFESHLDGMKDDESVLQWLNHFLTFLRSDRGRSLPTDVVAELFMFATAFYTNLPFTMIEDTTSLQLFIEATVACDDHLLNAYLTDKIPEMDHNFIRETIKCMYHSRNPPMNPVNFLLDRLPLTTALALYDHVSSPSDPHHERIISEAALKHLIARRPIDLIASSDTVDVGKLCRNIFSILTSSMPSHDGNKDHDQVLIMQNAPVLLYQLAPHVFAKKPHSDQSVIVATIAKALFGSYRILSSMKATFDKSLFAMSFLELLKVFKFDFGTFAFQDLAINVTFLTDMRDALYGRPMSSDHNPIPSSDEDPLLRRLLDVIYDLLSVEFDPSLLMDNLGHLCHYMSPPLEPHPAL